MRDGVVHPIQATQESRFAASGRTYHRQHLLAAHVDGHVLERMLAAVVHVDVPAGKDRILERCLANRAVTSLMLKGSRWRMHAPARLEVQTPITEASSMRLFSARFQTGTLLRLLLACVAHRQSPESSGYVVVRSAVPGGCEHLLGRTDFDQLPHIHERRRVRYPRGLLKVVSHDGQAILLTQTLQSLFHP